MFDENLVSDLERTRPLLQTPPLKTFFRRKKLKETVKLCTDQTSQTFCLFPVISASLRLDKGSETGHMATNHSYLRQRQDERVNGTDVVHYGPSTSNKVCLKYYFICGYNVTKEKS